MRRLSRWSMVSALLAGIALFGRPAFTEPDGDEPDEMTKHDIERTVELRGLQFKTPPKIQYWKVDQLREMMKKDFDTELPEEKAEKVSTAMAAFGLVPKGYDIRKEMLELMTEQIAGFYHPTTKALCLIEGKSGTGMEQEIVTIHELDHALQDQNFDLTRLMNLGAHNDDLATAIKSVIEGEATMVMFDHVLLKQGGMTCDQMPGIEAMIDAQMRAAGGMAGGDKLAEAPVAIREALISQYIDGFKWCVGVKRGKADGWDGINAVWTDLPASMEQILHVDRYLERDMPQTVTLPKDLPGYDGWETVLENVHGEFSVKMILLSLKPKSSKSGAKAAEGWDGDTYRVVRKDGVVVSIWATVWDLEQDASEFAVAYSKALKAKYPELEEVKADGVTLSHDTTGGWVELRRKGKMVYVVEGGTEEQAKGAVDSLEKDTTFVEVKPGIGAKDEKKK